MTRAYATTIGVVGILAWVVVITLATNGDDRLVIADRFTTRPSTNLAALERARARPSLAISADARMIVVCNGGNTVDVVSADGGRRLAQLTHQDQVACVCFTPDGSTLATGTGPSGGTKISLTGDVALWNTAKWERVDQWTTPSPGGIDAMKFDSTGRTLLCASTVGTAFRIHLCSRKIIDVTENEVSVKTHIAVAPDHGLIAAVDGANLEVTNLRQRRSLTVKVAMPVRGLAFSPNEKHLAVLSADSKMEGSKVEIFDTDTGQTQHAEQISDKAYSIAFPVDDRVIVISSDPRSLDTRRGGKRSRIVMWTGKDWQKVATGELRREAIGGIATSAGGGRTIVCMDPEHTVTVYDVVSGLDGSSVPIPDLQKP